MSGTCLSQVEYLQVEEHGIIGNCLTAALVGLDGRIDWFCYPYFDSPSIFGSLLDHKKGGFFKIQPLLSNSSQDNEVRYKQYYWPDTNVLVTRFITRDCMGEFIDYMPAGLQEHEHGFQYLIRRVHVTRGKVGFHLQCLPAFNYGRDLHVARVSNDTNQRCTFTTDHYPAMQLLGTAPIQVEGNSAISDFELKEGGTHIFAFGEAYEKVKLPTVQTENQLFLRTVDYWRSWLNTCTYKGRWRELVYRSALALKLHCFEKTGAILTSVTCLPTKMGYHGTQDHRVMYIGSAAFTVDALLQIGFINEATQFMQWVKKKCKQAVETLASEDSTEYPLHQTFSISDTPLRCEVLSHLEGYKGAGAPRIGQDVGSTQTRLHVFGDLMNAVYAYNQYAMGISYDLWEPLCILLDWLCDHWKETDASIWESEIRWDHYTYSKVMTWVAFDRALHLADCRSFPCNRSRWLEVRDEIFLDVIKNGWSHQRQAFVQAYNRNLLDASVLIMPLVNFMSPSDPRMISTLDQILKSPEEGGLRVANCLVFKFQLNEAMLHKEVTYNVCSFWMIEALTRAGKTNPEKLKQARLCFEEMMGYANHLGLFCQEITYRGEHAGNYLHTLVHLTLICTAFDLDQMLNRQVPLFWT